MIQRQSPLAGAIALVLLAGCARATFVSTDARYVGRPATQPTVFLDRLPPFPYWSIGIIEVTAPSGTDLDEVVRVALEKGGEIGCDVVVDRVIHKVASAIPGAGPLLATIVPDPTHTHTNTTTYVPPPRLREFVCGIALTAGQTPTPAPPTPAAPRAPAVQRDAPPTRPVD